MAPKPKAADDDEEAEKSEDDYASIAFDAIKDGDKEAFTEAFKGAIRDCIKEEDSGGYEDKE